MAREKINKKELRTLDASDNAILFDLRRRAMYRIIEKEKNHISRHIY